MPRKPKQNLHPNAIEDVWTEDEAGNEAEVIHVQSAPRRRLSWLAWLLALLLLAALAGVGFLYQQNAKLKNDLAAAKHGQSDNQNASATDAAQQQVAQETRQLIDKVGQLIILPANEQPTVATVTDLDKLKGQPFFANAAVGDKVLIYPNNQKAILYRPGDNKIIAIAPFVNNAAQAPASGKLTVEIRNGSGVAGAANTWKAKLASDPQITVTKTGNAASGNYTGMLVVDLSNGDKVAQVSHLAQVAGAQVTKQLLSEEKSSTAEAVLIVGK